MSTLSNRYKKKELLKKSLNENLQVARNAKSELTLFSLTLRLKRSVYQTANQIMSIGVFLCDIYTTLLQTLSKENSKEN